MRVISGKYKRRKLQGFKLENTRPTMDRVKESMFAMIQNDIADSTCLDLFAGSGALGIEALSMGAKKCYFVDKSKEAIKTIKKNLEGITEPTEVLNCDYQQAIKYFKQSDTKFDLIFLDPPYQKENIEKIINLIMENKIINNNGLIIVETIDDLEETNCVKTRKISDKIIKIYQITNTNEN